MHLPPGEVFAKARQAGFYEVHVGGGGARILAFAANPAPRESDLTTLDVEAFIAGIGVRGENSEAGQSGGSGHENRPIDGRAWQLLLLICALLLGLDTLLSNRLSRTVPAS
jgi:hypothetical protein